jgi:hypothetical protein
VKNLGPLKRHRQIDVRVHHVSCNRHKEILVLYVPKHAISLSLEVRDHDQGLIDGIEHVSMASSIDANALGSCRIWENLHQRVITLMLKNKGLVIDQVVAQFTTLVNYQQERVCQGNVDDRWVTTSQRESDIGSALIFDQVEGNFALRQDCRPFIVHDNLLDGAEILALAGQVD